MGTTPKTMNTRSPGMSRDTSGYRFVMIDDARIGVLYLALARDPISTSTPRGFGRDEPCAVHSRGLMYNVCRVPCLFRAVAHLVDEAIRLSVENCYDPQKRHTQSEVHP